MRMNKTENLTPEQAIEILNGKGDHISTLKRVQANRIGAEAIERCMIAEKPIPKTYPYMEKGYQYRNTCPNCGKNLIKMLIYNETTNPNHCPNCGQLIDWSDVE